MDSDYEVIKTISSHGDRVKLQYVQSKERN